MKKLLLSAVTASLLLAGCSGTRKMSNQDKGVAIGAGSGAVVGGVIGRLTGSTGLGAIIGAGVGGVAGGVIGHRMDKQAEEIKKKVPGVKVDRVGEGIVVEFSQAVLFGFDQSKLTPNSYRSLDQLIKVLNAYPDTDIEIDGHTDSKGTAEYNQTLSVDRATAVSQYLLGHNISPARVKTVGYGKNYPKYSNDTEEGRAGNRRVEFQITANEAMKRAAEKEAGKG